MKTINVIIFCLTCFIFQVQSQVYQYHFIIDEELLWSYCDIVKRDVDSYDMTYYQLRFNGDSIINETQYKKVYQKDCSEKSYYIGAIRERDKKVYVIYNGDEQERLIYNFNLVEGEQMQDPYCNHNHTVTKIEMVEIAGSLRKKFNLSSYDTWIEGIGSLERFFLYPLSPVSSYDLGIRLNYQKKNNELIYIGEDWYFNDNECNESAVAEIDKDAIHIIFNSANNQIQIKGLLNKSYLFELMDLNGKQSMIHFIDGYSNCINANDLIAGLYVCRLSHNKSIIYQGKVLISKE